MWTARYTPSNGMFFGERHPKRPADGLPHPARSRHVLTLASQIGICAAINTFASNIFARDTIAIVGERKGRPNGEEAHAPTQNPEWRAKRGKVNASSCDDVVRVAWQ